MSSKRGVPAIDTLSEYFPYHDDGCEISASCLSCPLPQCKYDDPGCSPYRERQAARDRRVLQVRDTEGITKEELAHRFHISRRTVHRILARTQNGAAGRKA